MRAAAGGDPRGRCRGRRAVVGTAVPTGTSDQASRWREHAQHVADQARRVRMLRRWTVNLRSVAPRTRRRNHRSRYSRRRSAPGRIHHPGYSHWANSSN
jgi:hypothetical protein